MDGFDSFLSLVSSPLWISLKVASIATISSSLFAILAAWILSRQGGRMAVTLDTLCMLPLVLPPTVLGYYLIAFVGRKGLLGPWLAEAGINLVFSWQGAVVAAAIVIFPLVYKSARAAMQQVDHRLEDAARTLGASELRILFSISLPLASRGIVAGIVLAFARGMGEFGATLMIAGNIPGKTQTLALAIYSAFQAGEDDNALILALLTSAICCVILICAEYIFKPRPC